MGTFNYKKVKPFFDKGFTFIYFENTIVLVRAILLINVLTIYVFIKLVWTNKSTSN